MKRKAGAVTTIAIILFCFCAGASAAATSMPAATATIGQATDAAPPTIVEFIVAIRDAKDVATAATSYSKARTLDKNDTEIYEEYMKKMLTFGYPKIALYPAMELRRLQAKNGTAWGVLGYSDAKRGRYLPAFLSTMRGMQLLPDDPAIQNNAGILLAWYETRSLKPKLAPDFATMLSENSQEWFEKVKFAENHRKCTPEFSARVERIEKLKEEIRPAEKAARSAASDSSRASATYRKYSRAIANLEDDLRDLRRDYDKASRYNRTDSYLERSRRYRLASDIRSRMSSKQSRISSLKSEGYSVRRKAKASAEILSEAKKVLAKAQTALKAEESTKPSLTWLPPAVDGVITPENPNPPNFAAHREATSRPSALSLAEVRLKMAKLLLKNEATDKAVVILTEIVKKYPDTKAAKEAGELIKKHKTKGFGEL